MSFESTSNEEYSRFIHLSRYARYDYKEGRRETWDETVDRYIDYFWNKTNTEHTGILLDEATPLREAILSLDVMPSMRALMTAGEALDRDNVAGFNCSYLIMNRQRSFDELMYILMCGTGVGFSCERDEVKNLPVVAEEMFKTDTTIVVSDSKIGWASAFRELLSLLYSGKVPKWDLSRIRAAGEPLKTFGGRACLTGDTVVYRSGKKAREHVELSIDNLVELKNTSGHFNRLKLRSVDESTGALYYNKLVDVIDNGIAPVYELLTVGGYRIEATANHRFMDCKGSWKPLSDFANGDEIAVNGGEKKTGVCCNCGTFISRRAKRCKPCFDIKQLQDNCLDTTARQRKQRLEYSKDFCETCGVVGERFEVHHVDGNPKNNEHSNLVNMCSPCHQKLHAEERTFGDGFSHRYMSWDEIKSITLLGEKRVYDLQMEGPNHNFIANGLVSHNSGPEPLDSLFNYSVNLFNSAVGRKLNSLEVHGLVCKIAEIVVVGGVRRSALISLSSFSDDRLRHAKSGQWWEQHPEFALANNSVAYTEKPDMESFMREWLALVESKSGERGIFNREASQAQAAKNGRRDFSFSFGTNPCSEIILRDRQFCNLSEVVVRSGDSFEDLKRKVKIATILGTLQATLTNFRYLGKAWKDNTEEEALLGVSLTGIMDHPVLSGECHPKETDDLGEDYIWDSKGLGSLGEVLEQLKEVAIETNKEWAAKLGINQSVAITAVKPSGTVSQLVDSASGIHTRHAPYYIRTVRADQKDPLAQFMLEAGFPCEPDVMKPDSTYVFSFPIKAPEGSVFRDDRTAIQQLKQWLIYQRHWCEHKPSVTINVKDEEWLEVGAWVFKHFDEMSGISFLPHSNHTYQQAPYQEITEEEYHEAVSNMPHDVNWRGLVEYEDRDNTVGSQTMACSGSSCEVVDI